MRVDSQLGYRAPRGQGIDCSYRNEIFLYMGSREYYLLAYNVIQFTGWAAALSLLLRGSPEREVYDLVYVFQSLSMLEILNVLVGIVQADLVTTFIQVFSRLQVLLVHHLVDEARSDGGNYYMLIAWCLVEVIRYPFLGLKIVSTPPYILTWLRYSVFYILYPIGVYGEMMVIHSALPSITFNKTLSITLPNAWNIEFDFASYLKLLVYILYLPGLAIQYSHMIKQRKNALVIKGQ